MGLNNSFKRYMYLEQISESLTFHLQNVAFLSFDLILTTRIIISPFTRMYLVTEGSGSLIIGNKKISPKPESST